MEKILTLVIYDIPQSKIRTKIAEACLDMGLERIQFSAFRGALTNTARKELIARLKEAMGKAEGRLFIVPICSEDWGRAFAAEQGGKHKLSPHTPSHETILRF